jgi:hypothetical protein
MSQRFSYVKYDQISTELQQGFKDMFAGIEQYANDQLPESRAKSLLMTALEEAYMWTGKAIRDDQIARTGQIDEQPERNNE